MRIINIGNMAGTAYKVNNALNTCDDIESTLFLSIRESGIASISWETESRETVSCFMWDRDIVNELTKRFFSNLQKYISLITLFIELKKRKNSIILAYVMFPIIAQFTGMPYVACALGSDIRELAFRKSFLGRLLRNAYSNANDLWVFNIDHLQIVDKFKIKNYWFAPFPIDTIQYSPGKRKEKNDSLIIFSPTNHDWKDYGTGIRWTKGNHLLIQGFSLAVQKHNVKTKLVLLKRGPDYEESRALCEKLKISDQVIWLTEMTKTELIKTFQECDVVADQFEIGSFGTIALEAMSCGKPLITYLDREASNKAYDEPPPIFNCNSAEAIAQAIINLSNKERLITASEQSRDWLIRHHSKERVGKLMEERIKQIL